MRPTVYVCVASLLVLLAAVWLGGCAPVGSSDSDGAGTPTSESSSTLTDAEEDAAQAAARSADSLAQAVQTAQSPTGVDDDEAASSFEIPAGSKSVTIGLCPQVSLTASYDGLLSFSTSLDFGSGCYPYGTTGYMCSGSATGSFDQAQKAIQMQFTNISCEEATLTGSVGLAYERSETAVDVTGTWDLTYVDSVGTILVNGSGTATYDLSDYTTTVSTFTGTANEDGTLWNVSLSNIQMSFPVYQRFLPFAGEMTVSGDNIRTFIIKFNENSPITGVVEVSINGVPFVETTLYAE